MVWKLSLSHLVLYFCPPHSLLYNLWIKHTTTTAWPNILPSPFSPAEFPTFRALLPHVLQFWAALCQGDFCPRPSYTSDFTPLGFRMGESQDMNAAPLQANSSLTGGESLWFLNDSSLCLFPTNFSQLTLALVHNLLLAFSCYL